MGTENTALGQQAGKVTFDASNYRTYLSYEKIQGLSSDQREALFKFASQQTADEKGLKQVDFEAERVLPDKDGRLWGGSCSQKFSQIIKKFEGHELSMNSYCWNRNSVTAPYSSCRTMYHELEHAAQFERSIDRGIKNSDPAALEMRLNDGHYYRSNGDKAVLTPTGLTLSKRFGNAADANNNIDFHLYQAQACETEARRAGIRGLEEMQKYNREHGISDYRLDAYVSAAKAEEAHINRSIMKDLGMHPREQMAKEQLSQIPKSKISEEDRARVLQYAREKDYEMASEVLRDNARGQISEEEVREQFDKNIGYPDFFESQEYQSKKATYAERLNYQMPKYRWSENASENENSQSFFDSLASKVEGKIEEKLDNAPGEKFFSGIERRAEGNAGGQNAAAASLEETQGKSDFFDRTESGQTAEKSASASAEEEARKRGAGQGQTL